MMLSFTSLKKNLFSCLRYLIPSYLFLFILPVCLAQSNDAIQGTSMKIRIDPTNARGGMASEIFDEVDFIPLETTKKSLFGKISQLEVTSNNFILSDQDTRSILVFDKNGKFMNKINYDSLGLKFLNPNFTVDRQSNEIIVQFFSSPEKIFFFNFQGVYLREERLPESTRSLAFLNQNNIIYAYDLFLDNIKNNKSTEFFLKYIDEHGNIVKELLPFSTKNIPTGLELSFPYLNKQPLTFYGEQGNYLFTNIYDYTIRQLTKTGISKNFELILPEGISLPPLFLIDSSYNGKRFGFLDENSKKVYKLINVFLIGDLLVFKMINYKYLNKDIDLAYNLKSHALYSWVRVSPDSLSFDLPIITGVSEIVASDNQYLYVSTPSYLLFSANEKTKGKVSYNEVLEKYFAKSNRNANPVIIRLKPKRNL